MNQTGAAKQEYPVDIRILNAVGGENISFSFNEKYYVYSIEQAKYPELYRFILKQLLQDDLHLCERIVQISLALKDQRIIIYVKKD